MGQFSPPAGFRDALEFAESNSYGKLNTFRDQKLGRLADLSSISPGATGRLHSFTPECIRPAAGK